jgi:hypothetical protein
MTDTDIRNVLARATDDVAPPADLLDRVRRGGQRRVVKRRAVLAAGVVALGVVPAAVRRGVGATDPQPAAPGDLGHDRRFLAKARAAWHGGYPFVGEAEVLWAGRTPAGPVALLIQLARFDDGQQHYIQGWVETVDGELRGVDYTDVVRPGTVVPTALLVGRERDCLVLADLGRPVRLSQDFSIDSAGKIQRYWTTPAAKDGVSVIRIAPQNTGRVRIGIRDGDEPVAIANLGDLTGPATTAQGAVRLDRVLPGAGTSLPSWDVTKLDGYADVYGYQLDPDLASWYIRGRNLVVQSVPADDGARNFYFDGSATPHYAGLVTTGNLLHVRMPGQLGVVVAYLNATFRYRVGHSGGWLPASGDAVLLPAAVREVEVTPRGGQPFVTAV